MVSCAFFVRRFTKQTQYIRNYARRCGKSPVISLQFDQEGTAIVVSSIDCFDEKPS
jgi:hypothetical protein